MAVSKFFSVTVLLLVVAATATAQISNSVQEESPGYFSGIMENMSSISEMDWQGMIRSVVETLMQYLVAPTSRLTPGGGADTSRTLASFEGDLVVNFIEKIGSKVLAFMNNTESGRTYITHDAEGFKIDPQLRSVIGTNPHLSDNKLIYSWRYVAWMVGYCLICTTIGVLSITLLPDPETLELIRNQRIDDYDTGFAGQGLSESYERFQGANQIGVADGAQSYESYMQNLNDLGGDQAFRIFYANPPKQNDVLQSVSQGVTESNYNQWMNHYNNQKKHLKQNEKKNVGSQGKHPGGTTSFQPQNIRNKRGVSF